MITILATRWCVPVLAVALGASAVCGTACGDPDDPAADAAVIDAAQFDAAAIDSAPVDPCASCAADEVCVQAFDGTCTDLGVTCTAVSAGCVAGVCNAQCEPEFCGPPLQCQMQVACGGEHPGASVYCYGP